MAVGLEDKKEEDKRMDWRDELRRLFGPGVAYADEIEDAIPENAIPPSISTGRQPYPDEYTRKAKWWEWIIFIPWRIWWNLQSTPGMPDLGPVPPTHRDWPGPRRPRPEDLIA